MHLLTPDVLSQLVFDICFVATSFVDLFTDILCRVHFLEYFADIEFVEFNLLETD